MQTTMSRTLPAEILDLIIDHLHDEPNALKTCCVVSKSWVPRTRRHLFAHVKLYALESHVERWKKAFPDPSNSPAHHTRTLTVNGTPGIGSPNESVDGWIRAFRNVVHLDLSFVGRVAFFQFRGFPPAVRSLRLSSSILEAFDLICSFPLLEDLSLVNLHHGDGADLWNPPLTSPKLTGALDLRLGMAVYPVARRLLDFPGGLRFSKINATFFHLDAKSVTDLVSKCSHTLESLSLFYFPIGAPPLYPVTDKYLTVGPRHR